MSRKALEEVRVEGRFEGDGWALYVWDVDMQKTFWAKRRRGKQVQPRTEIVKVTFPKSVSR